MKSEIPVGGGWIEAIPAGREEKSISAVARFLVGVLMSSARVTTCDPFRERFVIPSRSHLRNVGYMTMSVQRAPKRPTENEAQPLRAPAAMQTKIIFKYRSFQAPRR